MQKANIEADLILFHPYDAWGYKAMGAEADDFYLRYAIARLSAFRNVWWSIANEYDLVRSKTMSDWDRFFRITQAEDPYSIFARSTTAVSSTTTRSRGVRTPACKATTSRSPRIAARVE